MTISLHNLKPQPGSVKSRKRIGRGNASGHGTYSTRGQKGQKQRSGGKKGLNIKGFKRNLLRIPKSRGFKSLEPKAVAFNLSVLEKNFNDNDEVNPITLTEKNIIESPKEKVKILSLGEISKKLTVKDCQISKMAKDKIEKAGGKVILKEVKKEKVKGKKETSVKK